MLEIAVIRNNADEIKKRLAVKNFKEINLIDQVITADEQRRSIQTKLDENLAKQNLLAKEIGLLFKQGFKVEADTKKQETLTLKEESKLFESQLANTEEGIKAILVQVPNTPHT